MLLFFVVAEVAYVLVDQLRFLIIFVAVLEDLGVLTDLDKELLVIFRRSALLAALESFARHLQIDRAGIIDREFLASEMIDLGRLHGEAFGAAAIACRRD